MRLQIYSSEIFKFKSPTHSVCYLTEGKPYYALIFNNHDMENTVYWPEYDLKISTNNFLIETTVRIKSVNGTWYETKSVVTRVLTKTTRDKTIALAFGDFMEQCVKMQLMICYPEMLKWEAGNGNKLYKANSHENITEAQRLHIEPSKEVLEDPKWMGTHGRDWKYPVQIHDKVPLEPLKEAPVIDPKKMSYTRCDKCSAKHTGSGYIGPCIISTQCGGAKVLFSAVELRDVEGIDPVGTNNEGVV